MNAAASISPAFRLRPWSLAAALIAAALALSFRALAERLPPAQWLGAVLAPDSADLRQLLIHHSFAPRIIVSILCGAALALAGTIFQQALRNPLASPTTLGVSAGAKLALTLATVWAPGLFVIGGEWIALAGGGAALLLVLALAWRMSLSPLAMTLAGLVCGLYCGTVAAVFILFKEHYLVGLFIWGGGSLSQQGWDVASSLALRLAVACALVALIARPLTLLGLEDESARSLGLSLFGARLAALSLATALTAFVVSLVGVIGFIGLIAPTLARLTGARRLRAQMMWSPLIGAALLWLTDQLVQTTGGLSGGLLPTGAATALLGSPLLLWLLPRLRVAPAPPRMGGDAYVSRLRHARPALTCLGCLLMIALAASLSLGRTPEGDWGLAYGGDLMAISPWRAPRAIAALSAGAMLAVAGVALQRMTRNPMASPEVLGVSAGAALGLVVALFAAAAADRHIQILAASLGALFALAAMIFVGRRSGFAPDRMLLAGIALGALFDAVVSALAASGDPRGMLLMTWMTGSTYHVDEAQAAWCAGAAALLLVFAPLCARWLDLLPLGDASGRALGVNLPHARLALLGLTAALTASATLVVGPLTFVGLLAPHLATRLGLQRALPQLVGAALIGALVMVVADWLGRMIAFPWQIPAGLIATLIGCPALVWLLARRSS